MLADSSTPPADALRQFPPQQLITMIGDRIEVVEIRGTNTRRLLVAVPTALQNSSVSSPATWGRLLATWRSSSDAPAAHQSELVCAPYGLVMTRHCALCGLHLDDAIDLRSHSMADFDTRRCEQRAVALLEPLERAGEQWKREHAASCRPFRDALSEEERQLLHGAMRLADRAINGHGLCSLSISTASGTSFVVSLPRLDVRIADGETHLGSPAFLSPEGADLTAALSQIVHGTMSELSRRAEIPESIVFIAEMRDPDHDVPRAVVALITRNRAVEAVLSADRSQLEVAPSVGLVLPFAGALGVWHSSTLQAAATPAGMLS